MKYALTSVIAAAIPAVMTFAQQRETVAITLSSCAGDTLTIATTSDDMMALEKTDTVILSPTGQYTYTAQYPRIKFINLRNHGGAFGLILRPGESAVIEGKTLDDAHISGSPFYESQEAVNQLQRPLEEERKAFAADIMGKINNAQYDQDSLNVLSKEWSANYEKRVTAINREYITQHPDDDYSVFLLTQLIMDYDNAKTLVSQRALTGVMSPLVSFMDAMSERIKQRMKASELLSPGNTAPEIRCNDINGNSFDIKSLQGKVVVLDFWGSWCGWCIKGMPKMKEYYSKYAGKLEIVGVDCNDTEEKWRAAVKKHSIPWLHVRSVPGDQDLTIKFNVTGFPTKVVIGADGKIVNTFIGESDDFYVLLDKLLN